MTIDQVIDELKIRLAEYKANLAAKARWADGLEYREGRIDGITEALELLEDAK